MSTEALSLSDFAAQLSAAEPESGQVQETPEGDEQGQAQVEEATPEEGSEQVGQSTEEAPNEEADPEAGQADAAPDDEKVIKWKTAAGDEHEAPLRELKDGYLRQSDYTQKTQQLSQEREKAQKAVLDVYQQAQALGPELGRLHAVQEQIARFQALDWNALQQQDQQQYNTLANQFLILREQGKELLASAQAKANNLDAIKQRDAAEATAAAGEHLRKVIKGFSEKHLEAMNEHMTGKGLKSEELPEIVRRLGKGLAPAVLEAIHEAAQWRELQAKRPEVTNRAKAIPPKPAARAQQSKPTSQQEQIAKVAASGKTMSTKTFAELMAQTRRK